MRRGAHHLCDVVLGAIVGIAGSILLLAGLASFGSGSAGPASASVTGGAEVTAATAGRPALLRARPPRAHYVAVCDGNGIEYFDTSSGALVHRRRAPILGALGLHGAAWSTSGAGDFRATTRAGALPGACGYSFDAGLRRVAGIRTDDQGHTVPAYLDIVTGVVTDASVRRAVAEDDAIAAYVAAGFDPRSEDLWSLRSVSGRGPDDRVVLVGPDGAEYPYECGGCASQGTLRLAFGNTGGRPAVVAARGVVSGDRTSLVPVYLSRDDLPRSSFSVGGVRLADDGSGAAFTASPSGGGPQLLFTVPATGGVPRRLAELAPSPGHVQRAEVIRYRP